MIRNREIIREIKNYRDIVFYRLHKEVKSKLMELLEKKHLYQNVNLDIDAIKKIISTATKENPADYALGVSGPSSPPSDEEVNEDYKRDLTIYLNSLLQYNWEFGTEKMQSLVEVQKPALAESKNKIKIILSTINIPCKECNNDVMPHDSGYRGQDSHFPSLQNSTDLKNNQLFFLPYQCQKCKGEPIMFLVKREYAKLQLVGRSFIESVPVPEYIPKEDEKFYKEAILAFNCGRTLAALFYLRVMIEQYVRRILQTKKRISGDELCKQYLTKLPGDFPKERSVSLKTIYEELSKLIHNAKDDEKQFEKSLKDIKKHFDHLRICPLEKTPKKRGERRLPKKDKGKK